MMSTMHPVAKLEDLPPGASRTVGLDGKEVALFNVEGRLYAIGNRCPHRSGPLSQGRVERVTDPAQVMGLHPDKSQTASGKLVVRCPIHGWIFDLATGECLTRPSACTPSFPVLAQDGDILLGSDPI